MSQSTFNRKKENTQGTCTTTWGSHCSWASCYACTLMNVEQSNLICKWRIHRRHGTVVPENEVFLIFMFRFYPKCLDFVFKWKCCHLSFGSGVKISFFKENLWLLVSFKNLKDYSLLSPVLPSGEAKTGLCVSVCSFLSTWHMSVMQKALKGVLDQVP